MQSFFFPRRMGHQRWIQGGTPNIAKPMSFSHFRWLVDTFADAVNHKETGIKGTIS